MPLKPNKAASSTARQTRSVTRARNAAARPTTANREDVQPASPPRPSNALSNSLAHPTTANRDDVSPPWPNTPMANSSARPATLNRDDVSPPRPSTPMSSHYVATPPNIRVFCHTASPAGGVHNTLASRYVPTHPNFLDSRRATSPAVVHHNAFSFRHSSPPLISTNLAEMQNAFSFRHTASPPIITTHNAFSFRHTVSSRNVFPHHASSPPRTYNGMQASQLASPHVPIPLNYRSPLQFHSARPSSPSVRTPLSDRSPLRFGSARLSSPPVPTPLNGISPRFRHARLARPSSPLVPTPLNSRSPLIRSGVALTPPFSGQESGLRRMASDPAAPHEANSSRQRNAFNITVDLTDSPLTAAPHLNATVDLTDSPFNAPIPPMENTGGASATIDNSPGTSPIRCPVCLDGHARIASTGRRLMSTVCGHIFCSACLPVCIRSSGRCPTCRSVIRRKDVHPVYI